MRKRVISFLYSHRLLAWLLPVFHLVIGRSRIHIGKKNFCLTTTTNIYKSSVKNSGGKNR